MAAQHVSAGGSGIRQALEPRRVHKLSPGPEEHCIKLKYLSRQNGCHKPFKLKVKKILLRLLALSLHILHLWYLTITNSRALSLHPFINIVLNVKKTQPTNQTHSLASLMQFVHSFPLSLSHLYLKCKTESCSKIILVFFVLKFRYRLNLTVTSHKVVMQIMENTYYKLHTTNIIRKMAISTVITSVFVWANKKTCLQYRKTSSCSIIYSQAGIQRRSWLRPRNARLHLKITYIKKPLTYEKALV